MTLFEEWIKESKTDHEKWVHCWYWYGNMGKEPGLNIEKLESLMPIGNSETNDNLDLIIEEIYFLLNELECQLDEALDDAINDLTDEQLEDFGSFLL